MTLQKYLYEFRCIVIAVLENLASTMYGFWNASRKKSERDREGEFGETLKWFLKFQCEIFECANNTEIQYFINKFSLIFQAFQGILSKNCLVQNAVKLMNGVIVYS